MLLELEHIQKNFSSARDVSGSLLEDVSLSVGKGSVTALIGGNGTGKTTLFNIISGFDRDYRGRVILGGRDISKLPPHKIARLGVGRLFQGRQLMGDLTLLENMMVASDEILSERPLASILHPRRTRMSEAEKERRAVDILVRFFGENSVYLQKLHEKASSLSYGQQRLIAFVRLLMDQQEGHDRILLLDEPTSGVNPEFVDTLRSVIGKMVREDGVTVLMIEHNMAFVRSLADVCHYLSDGRIIKSGEVKDILDDPVIRKDYLGL